VETIEKTFPKRGKFLELQKRAPGTTQLHSITTHPPRKNHQFVPSFSATPLKKAPKNRGFCPGHRSRKKSGKSVRVF
jgi:hypothetical protein